MPQIPNFLNNVQTPLGQAFANLAASVMNAPSDADRYKAADEAVLKHREVQGKQSLADQFAKAYASPGAVPKTVAEAQVPAMPATPQFGTPAGDLTAAASPIMRAFGAGMPELEGPSMGAPAPAAAPAAAPPVGPDWGQLIQAAIHGGVDPSKLGGYNLFGAANNYGVRDTRTTNAQVGAGQGYSTSAESFDINQNNDLTKARENQTAMDRRNEADNAAADRRAAAGRSTQLQIAGMADDRADRRMQMQLDKGEKKDTLAAQQRAAGADVVLGKIEEAKGLVSGLTTGLGSVLNRVPGTKGYTLDKTIDTIKSNLGFDALQAMRASSPTGGALGAISDKENTLLQSTVASLDTGLPDDVLLQNLEQVGKHYNNIKMLQQGKMPPEYSGNKAPPAPGGGVEDLLKKYGN